jgi:broad specificity phosphatase PhoE
MGRLIVIIVRHAARQDRDGAGSSRAYVAECPPGHAHDSPLSSAGRAQAARLAGYIVHVLNGFHHHWRSCSDAPVQKPDVEHADDMEKSAAGSTTTTKTKMMQVRLASSPLVRCVETAAAIFRKVYGCTASEVAEAESNTAQSPSILLHEGLYEFYCQGLFPEKPTYFASPMLAELIGQNRGSSLMLSSTGMAFIDGCWPENRRTAAARVSLFVRQIVFPPTDKMDDDRAEEEEDRAVILVSHQFACKSAVEALLPLSLKGFSRAQAESIERESLCRFSFLKFPPKEKQPTGQFERREEVVPPNRDFDYGSMSLLVDEDGQGLVPLLLAAVPV